MCILKVSKIIVFSSKTLKIYSSVCSRCLGAPQQCRITTMDPKELESQTVGSHFMWVLGTKARSSARVASTPNHSVISLVPFQKKKKI